MNISKCKTIYDAALAAKACKGNIEAAKRYLDAGDVEGFERVCRGNLSWLRSNCIHYVLSDGIAEEWHDNGVLYTRYTYVSGEIKGVYETWDENGILRNRCNFKDNRLDGLYTQWYENGVMSKIDKEIHEINVLIKERKAAAAAKQAEKLAKRDQDNPEVIAKRFMRYLGIGASEV